MKHMNVFNTLTRKKEEFIPLVEGEYKIYVCGPTVYNYIHIGNARPLCVFDVLRRYLEYRGYKVDFVSNFTDVDDKLIRADTLEYYKFYKPTGYITTKSDEKNRKTIYRITKGMC